MLRWSHVRVGRRSPVVYLFVRFAGGCDLLVRLQRLPLSPVFAATVAVLCCVARLPCVQAYCTLSGSTPKRKSSYTLPAAGASSRDFCSRVILHICRRVQTYKRHAWSQSSAHSAWRRVQFPGAVPTSRVFYFHTLVAWPFATRRVIVNSPRRCTVWYSWRV